MKTYTSPLYIKIVTILFLGTVYLQPSINAQSSNRKTNSINCNTIACIVDAMINAQPGDEIIIAPGTYSPPDKVNVGGKAARFASANDGTAASPITVRAMDSNNPPILKGPDDIYDAYVMHITGDYWILKDLILEEGSKGLVFDNANFGIIENLEVRELGEEGIHLRDGSSNNLITNCKVYNVGRNKPGIGEGLYVGSDKNQHFDPDASDEENEGTYNRDCHNNTIEYCTVGPNVTAEGVDVKEGTTNTIIRNCKFFAEGITGENSADAFIDLKGTYAFVYNNEFFLDGSTIIASCIDFLDRGTGYNTGYRNAIFDNTFNLGTRGDEIPTARKKQGDPSEIHVWNNTRVPNTIDFPNSDGSLASIIQSCPSWNILPCDPTENQKPSVSFIVPSGNITLQTGYDTLNVEVDATDTDGTIASVKLYINNDLIREVDQPPYQWGIGVNDDELLGLTVGTYTLKAAATDDAGATSEAEFMITVSDEDSDGEGNCTFNTPANTALSAYDEVSFSSTHLLGQGPKIDNVDRFRISWNLQENKLERFAVNTTDGKPEYYVDLRDAVTHSFYTSQPEITLSNSGLPGWDGAYWVTNDGDNFIMVSKNNGFTLYFSNSTEAPECEDTLSNEDFSIIEKRITVYPNPGNKIIKISGLTANTTTIKIKDIRGRTIKSLQPKGKITSIDIADLSPALYIIVAEDIGFTSSKIFLKK